MDPIDHLLIFKRTKCRAARMQPVLFQNGIVLFEKTFGASALSNIYRRFLRGGSEHRLPASSRRLVEMEKISKLKFNLDAPVLSGRWRASYRETSSKYALSFPRIPPLLPSVLPREANYPRHVSAGETLPDCGEKDTPISLSVVVFATLSLLPTGKDTCKHTGYQRRIPRSM